MNYCEACEFCIKPGETTPPWKWTCAKHKRTEGFGFVTKGLWDAATPHLYCKDMNPCGSCPLYEPKRDQQMEMIK